MLSGNITVLGRATTLGGPFQAKGIYFHQLSTLTEYLVLSLEQVGTSS